MQFKRTVLLVASLLICIFFYFYQFLAPKGLCDGISFLFCEYSMDQLRHIFNLFPIILFFSAATFFLPKTTFNVWWKFARIAIPVSLGLILLINLRLHHSPGGWINLDSAIDYVVVSIIYSIFTLGSAIAIYRGHKRNRL